MSEPTPGQRGVLIGRLAAASTLRTTAGGGRMATLRITLKGTEDYVLTAFGLLVEGLESLAAGSLLYAEGRWQAREGGPPELLVDTLTPLTTHRPHDQPT